MRAHTAYSGPEIAVVIHMHPTSRAGRPPANGHYRLAELEGREGAKLRPQKGLFLGASLATPNRPQRTPVQVVGALWTGFISTHDVYARSDAVYMSGSSVYDFELDPRVGRRVLHESRSGASDA